MFQKPAIIARTNPQKMSSGMTTVPGMPRWWYGCDPNHSGSLTVHPVRSATASAIRVTRKISSPMGAFGPCASVAPSGTISTSLVRSRSSMSRIVIVCR